MTFAKRLKFAQTYRIVYRHSLLLYNTLLYNTLLRKFVWPCIAPFSHVADTVTSQCTCLWRHQTTQMPVHSKSQDPGCNILHYVLTWCYHRGGWRYYTVSKVAGMPPLLSLLEQVLTQSFSTCLGVTLSWLYINYQLDALIIIYS